MAVALLVHRHAMVISSIAAPVRLPALGAGIDFQPTHGTVCHERRLICECLLAIYAPFDPRISQSRWRNIDIQSDVTFIRKFVSIAATGIISVN